MYIFGNFVLFFNLNSGNTVTRQSVCLRSWPLITCSQFDTSPFDVQVYAIPRDCFYFFNYRLPLVGWHVPLLSEIIFVIMYATCIFTIHSVALQPLLGPGLPQKTLPFFSVFCSSRTPLPSHTVTPSLNFSLLKLLCNVWRGGRHEINKNKQLLVGLESPLSCCINLPYTDVFILLYRVIHKSLRDFRTRLRNNQDRHGRKEHINT